VLQKIFWPQLVVQKSLLPQYLVWSESFCNITRNLSLSLRFHLSRTYVLGQRLHNEDEAVRTVLLNA
jgi:hypothetical protein